MRGGDDPGVEETVEGLIAAYPYHHEPSGQPRPNPFDGSGLPTLTLPQAYEIQRRCTDVLCRRWNVTRAGFKVGLTNDRDQARFSVAEPIHGRLTSGHLLESASRLPAPPDGTAMVEPELLVRVLSDDLESSMNEGDLASRVEVAAGLDVAMTRYARGFAEITLDQQGLCRTVADNAFAGYVVMGDRWARLASDDIHDIPVAFHRGEEVVAQATTSHVLGNPLRAVQWLVQELHDVGQKLAPGWIVATGAILPPLRPEARGSYGAAFGRGLGTVTIHVD